MMMRNKYPKIVSVRILPGRILLVSFANGLMKIYDLGHKDLSGYDEYQDASIIAKFSVAQDDYTVSPPDMEYLSLTNSDLYQYGRLAFPSDYAMENLDSVLHIALRDGQVVIIREDNVLFEMTPMINGEEAANYADAMRELSDPDFDQSLTNEQLMDDIPSETDPDTPPLGDIEF